MKIKLNRPINKKRLNHKNKSNNKNTLPSKEYPRIRRPQCYPQTCRELILILLKVLKALKRRKSSQTPFMKPASPSCQHQEKKNHRSTNGEGGSKMKFSLLANDIFLYTGGTKRMK